MTHDEIKQQLAWAGQVLGTIDDEKFGKLATELDVKMNNVSAQSAH